MGLALVFLIGLAIWCRYQYQSESANHAPSPKGVLWNAAHSSDAPGVLVALARGASTEEADEVSCVPQVARDEASKRSFEFAWQNGVTALMAAIRRGSDVVVRVLLLAGADVLARDRVRGEGCAAASHWQSDSSLPGLLTWLFCTVPVHHHAFPVAASHCSTTALLCTRQPGAATRRSCPSFLRYQLWTRML